MTMRTTVRQFHHDQRGNGALQSVMILAVAALVLMGLRLIWAPGPSGSGGLMSQLEGKFETLFNGGSAPGGAEGPGASNPGGGGSGSGNGAGTGGGATGSDSDGSADQDGSGSGDSPGEDPDDGAGGSSGDPDRDPDEKPDGDDSWEDYADIAMAVALESSKEYGQRIVNDAKAAALREVATNDPLLEAFGMSIRDFQIESPSARAAVFDGAGIMVDALVGVDGLIQGDQKVKELARAGDYRGAWRTTWSTPAKFIADTIFASKPVDAVLDRLPASVQIAVKVGVPEAVEGATGAAADALFDPVATRINAALWNLYDGGYVPQPRMPRP